MTKYSALSLQAGICEVTVTALVLQERPRRAVELILLTLLLHCLEIGALLSATAILEELLRAMHRVLVKMYGGSRVLWEVLSHYGSLSHTNSSDVVP